MTHSLAQGKGLFERYWGSYYWIVMGITLALAFLIQLPWRHRSDIIADAMFLVWTGLCFLASRRWPFHARLVHALGVIPILSFYASQPDTAIPADLGPQLYLLLVFFPIYTATAMVDGLGFALTVFLSWVFGQHLFQEPGVLALVVFFWSLAGLLGLGYYRLVKTVEAYHTQLEKLALSDPLTGLGNRRALQQDFPRYQALARREGKRLVMTLWDVNNLKEFNDRYGHAAGDLVLKKFAQALSDCSRKSDAFYRIGGDEFAGLHLGLENPELVINRVRERFAWVSVGWADATDVSLDEAYGRADQNMYRDKENKIHEMARLTLL